MCIKFSCKKDQKYTSIDWVLVTEVDFTTPGPETCWAAQKAEEAESKKPRGLVVLPRKSVSWLDSVHIIGITENAGEKKVSIKWVQKRGDGAEVLFFFLQIIGSMYDVWYVYLFSWILWYISR